MSGNENLISIQILDRKYSIKCPANEAQELQEAASVIDGQMKKLRQTSSFTTTDQLAVVSALNVTHELLRLKKQKDNHFNAMNQRLQEMQKRIEKILAVEEEVAV